MSVSHWWFSFLVDEAEHARLLPAFKAAVAAPISEERQRGIEAWRQNPASFESLAPLRGGVNPRINDFLWAFNLPGIAEFSERFFFSGGDFSSFLSEERCFRFVSIARNPPVAVLWHALGYERARSRPGTMGNLLVAPADLGDAEAAVSRAYEGASDRELLTRAVRFCEGNIHSQDQVNDAITHLPDLLARARDQHRGILAFGRSEL